jgi:hypothetical protein
MNKRFDDTIGSKFLERLHGFQGSAQDWMPWCAVRLRT